MLWIKTLLAGTSGDPSTMRVAVLLILVAVLFNWTYLTIHTGTAQPLDWQEVSLIVGTLGVKAAQLAFEKPATPSTP